MTIPEAGIFEIGISPQAIIGQGGELIPVWAKWAGAVFLVILSVKPLAAKRILRRREGKNTPGEVIEEPVALPKKPVNLATIGESN